MDTCTDDVNQLADDDGEADVCLPSLTSSAQFQVFLNIHRRLFLASIDDSYTLESFRAPKLNALLVRPLVDRLHDPEDISIVYCLLANRVHFLREQSDLAHQSVNAARATLCELVATQIFRRFHEANPGQAGLLVLAHILVEGFDPFQGAPSDLEEEWRHMQWPVQERGGHEMKLTALELAIVSESKFFISSAACHRVVDAINRGQITYTPLSFVDILPDHYKHLPISIYNAKKARLLNHHRLIVPRTRVVIELTQFLVLLTLYMLTMINRHQGFTLWELTFSIYTTGWVLQEFAAIIEHGWELHSQSLWSFLDASFIFIFGIYAITRLYDVINGTLADGYGLHILCVAAPVLLSRVAFNIMPDNVVFISLHAVMKDFTLLTFIAFWCFTGFLLALQWLTTADQIEEEQAPGWLTVTKWLLWIWFGLDGTGIGESANFHVILGPVLMVAFAFLGNTLFLTILVAMLTNTFGRIVANESAEIRFHRTVLIFESVKSDSIFSYPPPLNIAALITLLPLKFLVTSRLFHTINVFLIRVLNAPVLLLISFLERRIQVSRPRNKKSWFGWHFTGFSPHGDVRAVFKANPPPYMSENINQLDPLEEIPVLEADVVATSQAAVSQARLRRATMRDG
ncbi:hypothetical protein CEP54_011553 [Fusarium duplospermum]|uniref:Nonselective cation channel n=1 Tax=Fusarium duplospermum TaxID=1325734 RepID=A0A428PDP2_9HYPO|nr:hypothetical protein CEP54_011553 [Fusarium duplospermum]